MFTSSRVAIVLPVLSTLFGVCSAQIPGVGNVPGAQISILGAANGHTTYEVVATASGIVATETLVLGATDASFTLAEPAASLAIGGACGINNGVAVCTIVDNSFTITATATLGDLNLPTAAGGGATGGGGATAGSNPTTAAAGTGAGGSTPSPSSGGSSSPPKSGAMSTHASLGAVAMVVVAIWSGIQIL
ncbi:hypothetical protein BD410DRAFT_794695 [Rickenella mellea]|uniref:Uncharacterized protein n=1 Tax=Rickenella mellea TaxID=50990 RepID=A0A4Y7PPD0_9AGAM|nr:hypothetical protein BD410DRAFT_794695 [Rickenella mellea]